MTAAYPGPSKAATPVYRGPGRDVTPVYRGPDRDAMPVHRGPGREWTQPPESEASTTPDGDSEMGDAPLAKAPAPAPAATPTPANNAGPATPHVPVAWQLRGGRGGRGRGSRFRGGRFRGGRGGLASGLVRLRAPTPVLNGSPIRGLPPPPYGPGHPNLEDGHRRVLEAEAIVAPYMNRFDEQTAAVVGELVAAAAALVGENIGNKWTVSEHRLLEVLAQTGLEWAVIAVSDLFLSVSDWFFLESNDADNVFPFFPGFHPATQL